MRQNFSRLDCSIHEVLSTYTSVFCCNIFVFLFGVKILNIILYVSSLNVALIPAIASTSPSDWGSVATFVFSIRLRTLANRPSMSCVMLEEAGVEIEEDIVLSNLVSQARFYPTSVKALCPTTPNYT